MTISKELKALGLLSGEKTMKIFDALYSDLLEIKYSSESALIRQLATRCWSARPSAKLEM